MTTAAGNPVFCFHLDWTARVSQVAPHLSAYGAADFVWKCSHRLTGGSATPVKGTITETDAFDAPARHSCAFLTMAGEMSAAVT